MQQFNQQQPFGRIRNFFWPIYNYELKKLIPMFLLFFLISFAYNLLRNMKTSLIVTASDSGAAVIPYLKIGAVLPVALIFTYIFTKLINHFNREQVFYTILGTFLAYFALFALVLYPNNEALRLDSVANYIESHAYYNGLDGLIALIRHWNLSLFYVLAEMWSAVVLSMLFWGFANEVTKVNEAKRFYAIFALGANCSGIFSGLFAKTIQLLPEVSWLPYVTGSQWILYQLLSVLGIGVGIISIFYWLNRNIFHLENVASLQIPKKARKISLTECFSFLRRSRYLAYIVTIVVAYNIVYNLSDVMWMYKIKQVYSNSRDVNAYMNQISAVTGIVAVAFAFVVSGNVIRYYGWTVAALITPLIWLMSSFGFFSGLVLESSIGADILANLVSNPGNLVLLLGSIQICFGRGCKYTVFDETKEIAFIPLSKEEQRKSKAIVDGLASRFGKSGGSMIQIFLLTIFGSVANTVPYVSFIIMATIIFWIVAVMGLGRLVSRTLDQDVVAPIAEEAVALTKEATTGATA